MKKALINVTCSLIPFPGLRRRTRDILRGYRVDKTDRLRDLVVITTDIPKIPAAVGHLRRIQQALNKLSAAFDRLCAEKGIQYFVMGGSLIGKLRHNGWIPWDDDVDFAVVDGDWDKMMEFARATFPNADFDFRYSDRWHNLIQLVHRKTGLRIDVFKNRRWVRDIEWTPGDFAEIFARKKKYSAAIRRYDIFHFTRTAQTIIRLGDSARAIRKKWEYFDKIMAAYDKIWDETMMDGAKPAADGAIISFTMLWFEAHDFHKNATVFPVRRTEFDGITLSFPNDIEMYAEKYFGDIWRIPQGLAGHSPNHSKNFLDFLALKSLAEADDDLIYKELTTSSLRA
jgi:phosphorylcholine metabolism protein LicD